MGILLEFNMVPNVGIPVVVATANNSRIIIIDDPKVFLFKIFLYSALSFIVSFRAAGALKLNQSRSINRFCAQVTREEIIFFFFEYRRTHRFNKIVMKITRQRTRIRYDPNVHFVSCRPRCRSHVVITVRARRPRSYRTKSIKTK